ncbi:peptidoglycan DD-metalloendopeptidase family protein [Vibrio sp. LaRot3]|uniref:peptidoglycan DD-metalloendopeptidase family protein n=1 Tax=Vibrio sp. LaRot3 TaxID=2998829 RepID=UPI0022CE11B0|nr:peptidoglycan DD-metalloendopeptidase family protein [Vibrio sp. LaRot3]MDA0148678.1 peptidoglycan DD-metalloendopeptidase family protein [Vibrio sp. LaRot3]
MLSLLARLPRMHQALIVFITLLIVVALLLPDSKSLRTEEGFYKVGQTYPLEIKPENLTATEQASPLAQLRWEKYQVQSGESAAVVFQRAGLSSRLLYQLTTTNNEIERQLTKLRPGDVLQFGFDANDDLIQIKRQLSAYETYLITKKGDVFVDEIDQKEVVHQYNYAEASITSNFWNAAITAGLTANQIMELAGIFGWDIDFALDIRTGDSFKILYQEKIVEGEVVGRGKIIAAIFTNQGDTFKAILDDNTGNYYDEKGRAMKKAFLRSPLDFRRVTSNFNPTRRHPVTGKVRAHRGTDYAAPVGTPIWAAGDGIVQKSSYNQFNGNYVFIKHSNTYITKYLHLKRRTVKTGQRVKQGQTIGTLGGTGRVTGPHLHYEFLVHGVHKNARTVKLPQSKSLKGKAKQTFIANAEIRLNKLERYRELLANK